MAAFLPFVPVVNKFAEALLGSLSPRRETVTTLAFDETVQLREELAQYRKQHSELLERFNALTQQLKQKKIETFEELAKQDQQTKTVLVQLAQKTNPIKLEGINVGLFGITSTGKSTMLNALLGEERAETGIGETTIKITPYKGTKFTLWDVPGRNDELSYFTMEYISFFKGLSHRLILIQATVKENSSMMELLDEIGLNYDIVFNKFDQANEHQRVKVQEQIRSEVQKKGLKKVNLYI